MNQSVEKIAKGLLAHMHLSCAQAAVLLDQSSDPETLRVYIFDDQAAQRSYSVTQWCGYRVDVVRGVKVEPHAQPC